jgi:hypothetical protein
VKEASAALLLHAVSLVVVRPVFVVRRCRPSSSPVFVFVTIWLSGATAMRGKRDNDNDKD